MPLWAGLAPALSDSRRGKWLLLLCRELRAHKSGRHLCGPFAILDRVDVQAGQVGELGDLAREGGERIAAD